MEREYPLKGEFVELFRYGENDLRWCLWVWSILQSIANVVSVISLMLLHQTNSLFRWETHFASPSGLHHRNPTFQGLTIWAYIFQKTRNWITKQYVHFQDFRQRVLSLVIVQFAENPHVTCYQAQCKFLHLITLHLAILRSLADSYFLLLCITSFSSSNSSQ